MPITSDASTFTSVSASPMELHDPEDIPIELKIPLPTSSSCSDQDLTSREKWDRNFGDQVNTWEEREGDSITSDQAPELKESQDGLTNGILPEQDPGPSCMSLEDLAGLVQLEKRQRLHHIAVRSEVERLSFSCGLDERLRHTFSIAYGNMIDQYKTDDQAGFAGLYEACEHLAASYNASDASFPDGGSRSGAGTSQDLDPLEDRSCIHRLPLDDQSCIITFLNQIRTNPEFLADHVSRLPSSELIALTSSYHPAGVDLSILSNHSHGSTHAFSRDSQMMKLSRRMDSINRCHKQGPYFSLLYNLFNLASNPGSLESYRRTEVWGATCAKVIAGRQLGSEEFTIATVDAFAQSGEWTLKPKMELYLMKVLAEGSFILDAANQPTDLKEAIETRNATHAIAIADFFDKQLIELFELLSAEIRSGAVPKSVLTLVHATLRKIQDSQTRELAKKFIVSRWYFASFLSSVLVYPEVQGLMMTHHIGQTARIRILKDLAIRMQTQVFNVMTPWANHPFIAPEVHSHVSKIVQYFEPTCLADPSPPDPPTDSGRAKNAKEASSHQLMLSHWDVIGLVEALHPKSDHLESRPLDLMSPPSTASSSTLKPGPSDVGSSEAPSFTPSSTGTLITIDKTTQEIKVPRHQAKDGISSEAPDAGAHHIITGNDPKPLHNLPSRLQDICSRLKAMSRAITESEARSISKDWTLFDLSRDGLDLALNYGRPQIESLGLIGIKDGSNEVGHYSQDYQNLKSDLTSLLASHYKVEGFGEDVDTDPNSGQRDPLQLLLYGGMAKARSQYDFETAHQWWKSLKTYLDLMAFSSPSTFFQRITKDITEDLQTSVRVCDEQADGSELRVRSLADLHRNQQTRLAALKEERQALRIKMWYSSDVRHSSTYEEALLVTQALRAMANPKRAKQPGGVTSWARQRLRGSSAYEKAESQTLEALSAPREHGGITKLADEQIEMTTRWLTRSSIENFCKGEERIHRFCYEVKKSVGKLAGPSLLESPVLWSSNLFKREKSFFGNHSRRPIAPSPSLGVSPTPLASYNAGLRSPSLPSMTSTPLGFAGSGGNAAAGYVGGSQPSPISRGLGIPGVNHDSRNSLSGFWSNYPSVPITPPITPASPNFKSLFSSGFEDSSVTDSALKIDFIEDIKNRLCSLITSDLGYLLWSQGSETDLWVNKVAEEEQKDKLDGSSEKEGQLESSESASTPVLGTTPLPATTDLRDQQDSSSVAEDEDKIAGDSKIDIIPSEEQKGYFPFVDAYSTLLQKMSFAQDPYIKLQMLCQLENLILNSLQDEMMSRQTTSRADSRSQTQHTLASVRSRSTPRTKATSLEEVMANCTERRAGTLRLKGTSKSSVYSLGASTWNEEITGTEEIVSTLLSLFRTPNLRPQTLFRDLQYIAAFIPSNILDRTPQGKAFWDAGLAALALKEDLCNHTIHRATEITNYHITPKKPSPSTPAPTFLASTTLRHAAHLWLIAAKEGSPPAARELGLFYLTHPDLLRRVTMPFSKAKDVFKAVAVGGGDKETGALDPLTFAVVLHWMEIAANSGDREARDFLKSTGQTGAGR